MTQNKPVDFYFDFVSPFGWIAAEQIGDLARAEHRFVRWRPILLKATVVDTMGLKPILDTPLKGKYAVHDARRSARLHGLSLAADAVFRFSPLMAARAVVWANSHAPDMVEQLVLTLYRRHWRDGRDISCTTTFLDAITAAGLDGDAVKTGIGAPETKQALRESTEKALLCGVFGSPTTVVDGELFWGADRLEQVALWMRTAGW